MAIDPRRIYVRETTSDGGIFYRLKDGSTQYDLSNSKNLLKDMNLAILKDTNRTMSGTSNGAIRWFMEAIETSQMIIPESHKLTETLFRNKTRAISKASNIFTDYPGRMYAFVYRPKNIASLDYYDYTPLIISLPRTREMEEKNLIFGMNLHYIDPEIREVLIERLLKISSRKFGEKMPPKGSGFFYIDYDVIKSLRFVFGMPCIRTYSLERVIGKPILIPSNEWGNAVALPFENFVKAKNSRVWVETRLKIKDQIRKIASGD